MISEQITVTSTSTSIADLLNTARGSVVGAVRMVGIMLRYGLAETVTVSLLDANGVGSVNGAVVLDAAGENLYSTSFRQFDTEQAFLKSSGADVTVHIIAEQTV